MGEKHEIHHQDSVSIFVSLFLPTHNWCTIGPLIIVLVPEDFKCSNKRPWQLCFPIQWSMKKQEVVKYPQDYLYWWLVQQMVKPIRCVHFTLLVNSYNFQRITTNISNVVFICAMLPYPRKNLELADSTWVQSIIARWYSIFWHFLMDNMVNMGTVSNSNNT